MTAVDAALVADACAELGVTDVREIGAPGGQKAVRQVTQQGRDLILKVVALRASSPASLKRAEREVELLQSLASPHVVRVESDLATIGSPARGAAWLEELLDGGDLPAYLGSQWTWAEAAELGYQVADGLAAAHAAGVIHRDLSPNNVRRLSNGTYKVMDFGFARHTLRSGLTAAGQPGTLGFLSPEHLNAYSGGPMPASDVFCVGILMYAALVGEWAIPYNGDEADYFRRLAKVQVTDIALKRPDLTDKQLAVMRRMLHPQPARRFVDGRRLASALDTLR